MLKKQQELALFSILPQFCHLKHGCHHFQLDDEAKPKEWYGQGAGVLGIAGSRVTTLILA